MATERSISSSSRAAPPDPEAHGGHQRDRPVRLRPALRGFVCDGQGQGMQRQGRPLVVLGHDQPRPAPVGAAQVRQALVALGSRTHQ